jgi:hypothetical protein
MPLVYPLNINGMTMAEILDNSIKNLPEKSYSKGSEYYGVFGKTSDGTGYTPVETQWLDINVHRGTGIVSAYDWYYNNNEYGITARSQVTLSDVNFDFSSRVSHIESLKTFTGDIFVEPDSVSVGEILELELELFDVEGYAVESATVTALIEGYMYILVEESSGIYSVSVDTKVLDPGSYQGTLVVEKVGFESIEGSFTFSISESISNSDPSTSAIPSMPLTALLIGILVFISAWSGGKNY